jgi:hypothetical protein
MSLSLPKRKQNSQKAHDIAAISAFRVATWINGSMAKPEGHSIGSHTPTHSKIALRAANLVCMDTLRTGV